MPLLFGIYSADPTEREAVREHIDRLWRGVNVASHGNWVVGGHSHSDLASLREIKGDLVGCDGEPSSPRRLATLGELPRKQGETAALLQANVFVLNVPEDTIRIECHESGVIPLYWKQSDSVFLFSSHLSVFQRLGLHEPDCPAVVAFLRNGYMVGDSSLLDGVRRLGPGQTLRFESRTGRLKLADNSQLWRPGHCSNEQLPPKVLAESVWQRIVAAVDDSFGPDLTPVLMLSGGWDSRTLLAATLATSRRPLGYAHGDPDSRELGLVRRMAGRLGIKVEIEPITDRCLDPDWLNSKFDRSENLVFPHWHWAGEVLSQSGARTVASGIYGEILGGHYGPSMELHGKSKVMAVARELLAPGLAASSAKESDPEGLALSLLHPQPVRRPPYIEIQWWNEIASVDDQIREAKRMTLRRFGSRGISNVAGLLEAYLTEQRGAQYIAAQPGSIRARLDTSQPYTESDLLRIASCIPIGSKIHNRLNREMLRTFFPVLTDLPMAATLVKAKRAVITQEATRLLRKTWERKAEPLLMGLGLMPEGYRFSWVNFEFLRMSDRPFELIDSLELDIWDRSKLRTLAADLASGRSDIRPHNLFDQLMKIYTVDASLRGWKPRSSDSRDLGLDH